MRAVQLRFRVVAILGSGLCLLVVLLFIALQSGPARRFAVSRITSILASQHMELRIGELRYNLLSLSIDARDLRLRSGTASSLSTFATIGRLRLDVSLAELLRGRYVVQSGLAEDVEIHYVIDADGRDNLPRPLSDRSEPREPIEYLMAGMSVVNARVHYANRPQQVDLLLSLPSAELTGNAITARHQLRFESALGQVRIRNQAVAVDRVGGAIDVGRDELSIDRLKLEAGGARAELAGSIRRFDAPELELTLDATVDASRAAALFDVRDPVAGTIAVEATAAGPLSAPAIATRMTGSGLQFRSLDAARVDVRAAYDGSARRAEVSSASLQAPWGSFAATGHVAVGRDLTSRMHTEFSRVDIGALMRGLDLPYAAHTRVDGQLDTEWTGADYRGASGRGTATLTPTRAAPSRTAIPLGGRLSARGSAGTFVAELHQITAAGAELTGQLRIADRSRLEGELRARVPDLARSASAAEVVLGRGHATMLPAPVGGAATIDVRLGGTVDRPIAFADIQAPSLSFGSTTGIAVGGDLAFTAATLTIIRGDANWEGAYAGVRGTVGLSGNHRLDLVLDADAANLQWLFRAVNAVSVPASGAVSAHGTVGGTVARPLASLTLRGTDLMAFGESFGSLQADAALAGPTVTVSTLVVEKPQPDAPGRITAAGSYNLDRKSYAIELQSENVRLLALTLPGGQQIRGNVQLSGRGSGSVSSPAGTINLAVDSLEIDGLPTRSANRHALAVPPPQLGRVVIAAAAANQQATVNISAERFNVAANAVVGLSRPWETTLVVRASDVDLARLPFDLPREFAGHLRATVNATGDLVEPARGRATATIESLAGSWNGQPYSVTSPGELAYENQRLAIERLQVTAGDASLSVTGELPLTARSGPSDLAIEARANVATLARFLPPDPKVSGDGVVTVAGSLRGTLTSIEPNLVIAVENGALLHTRLEPGASGIHLRARVADGAVDIERLTGRWGSATIDAAGRIPLEILPPLPVEIARRGGPAFLKASLRDLDPAAIAGAPAGLTGRITADVDVSATRAEIAALDGRIDFQQLELAVNRLTLAQREPSRIRIADGTATVEGLALSGSAGAVAASGTIGLAGERPVDLKVDGTVSGDIVSALTERVRADGTATWTLAARGPVAAPELYGTLDLADVTLANDDFDIAAANVNAHIDLAGTRLELTRLSGEINGGTLEGSGRVTLAAGTINDVDLQIRANDLAYDAPLDVRSLSDASIHLSRQGEGFLVAGEVTIKEAGLTSDIDFDQGPLASVSTSRMLGLTEARNPLLERVRFNIALRTATPAVVENRMARGEIDADLRLVGTPYEPGLTGRLTVVEGGQVTLNARRYEVERGVITFVDERRVVPSFDLLLNTQASNYDVRIGVTGSPGHTETSWTSEPALPEPDIMALVVTGRTLDEMRGEESEVARMQALTYLTGRVGSRFGGGIERATGISEVRIEPVLIANETDPTARLTVGQNLTHRAKLVYSTNLADSNDQIWVVEYDLTRRFQMHGVREREDDSYRFDFRHDVRFGGDPAPRRELRRRATIARLAVVTDSAIEEAKLRKLFRLKEGDTYEYFAARNGLERIEELYLESGYLQSRVRLDRHVDSDRADLTLRVTSGPIVDLLFEGATPPSKIQQEVRLAWHRAVFDRQRGDDSVRALREWLIIDNHLQPLVEYELEDVGERRRVVFRIRPGPRYDNVALAFEGASAIDPDRLDKIIEEQRLEHQLFTNQEAVIGLLERYYRDQGYLAAEIDGPRFEFQGRSARVILTVREGQRFAVGTVTVTGNTVYTLAEIAERLPLVSGAPFLSVGAEHASEQIRELYWRKGYNDTRSEYTLVADRGAARVDIAFTIVEGRQDVVADIGIEGNRRTSDGLVRAEVELSASQPLDLGVLARSRRNLYNTGAFSVADITRDNVPGGAPASAQAEPNIRSEQEEHQQPVRLNVSVREVQPFQLRYGLSYDTEGGLGGILDLSIHNSLGRARVAGVQTRYDDEVREGRLYLSQPSLRSWPRKTTASLYVREDLNPPTEQTDPFDISRKGASIMQEARSGSAYVWGYGYRYELATTLEPSLGADVTETVRVTPLSFTATRELRDEVLDASKGTFLSQAFAYSPSWLGSDRPYLKYYGQYFHYFPLRAPPQKPFTSEILRPRLVFATGVRIGLARGLGGEVPTSEHFYAGGSTTLRGFEQNAVGPIGVNNVPAGGNAVLVLNNELRMPLVRVLDGVLFVDVGNVFPTISDFSLTDLRQSAGVGVRVRTPWLLLRSDYGFVLDPRPGEARSRLYFSIGQAF
jgi:outer membrane protein assembly complex protein YaeT